MEPEKGISNASTSKSRLKISAKVCLIVLLLYIIGQLVDAWRTQYQLVSPLIPRSVIWEINKQILFKAAVALGMGTIGLSLYFVKRHLLVIILVIAVLIAERYIYI
jgi:hypothetical protein